VLLDEVLGLPTCAVDIGNRVRDLRGIAPVGNVSGECVSDFAPAIGKREQHHATVAGQAASIKRGL
jgi:hypothetical protein